MTSEKQTLSDAEKRVVRCAKHFKVYKYPKNWQQLPDYQNWRNGEGCLCGLVEIDGYLVTSVL